MLLVSSAFSQGYEVILVEDGHGAYNSNTLYASQIIHHHNNIHAHWFASVQKTEEIFL